MLSTTIFKKDSAGKVRTWQYEVEGAQWRTHAGIEGGKVVTSGWTTSTPKSRPTAEEQAQFEAEAEEAKKLDRLYRRSVEELGGEDMMFAPMLANKWKAKPGLIEKGIFMQPKLDGIRCIAKADGLFSREGQPILGMRHIEEALKPWFEDWPHVILDGELYNHEYRDDFEAITSAVSTSKTTHPDAGKIEYHIYDLYDPNNPHTTFQHRSQWVELDFGDAEIEHCVAVTTLHIDTLEGFNETVDAHAELGYEGSMARLDTPYQRGKRSSDLLKIKVFMDTEFEINSILNGNGNWAGYGKKLTFRMPDGRICGAGVKGKRPFLKKLLEEADQWPGKTVTIKHFGYTKDGFPRFPVAIKFWPEGKI